MAIALSGHLRMWNIVFPNFKERFIDRYNPEIFISTWSDMGFWVPEEGTKGIHEGSPIIDIKAVQEAYKPVRMVVENLDPFLPIFEKRMKAFPNYYHRPRNICSMFYKIKQSVDMVDRHVAMTGIKYDLVIRMRPDMLIHQPIPNLDPEKFYTIWHRNHVGGGTGDQMQIGSLENVAKFARIGVNLEAIYQKTGLLCPHVMSVAWIKEMNLPWNEIHISKSLQHTPNGEYRAIK